MTRSLTPQLDVAAPALLEMLDDVSAALETVWAALEARGLLGATGSPADIKARATLIERARAFCDALRGDDDEGEA